MMWLLDFLQSGAKDLKIDERILKLVAAHYVTCQYWHKRLVQTIAGIICDIRMH